jgi:hypothetical protein
MMSFDLTAAPELAIWKPALNPVAGHETFSKFLRLYIREDSMLLWRETTMMTTFSKQPPLLEDLRNHSSEQLAELRLLLASGAASRPDPRRPGFFEIDGLANIFYVFKYPTGSKVLLLGVWEKDRDPVAELVACSCPAA